MDFNLVFLALALLIFLLMYFGLIGPRKLREKMRKFNKFLYYDAALFMPIDPYKPIDDAIKESISNFLPTKKRFRNWLMVRKYAFIAVGIIYSLFIVGLIFYSNFFAR